MLMVEDIVVRYLPLKQWRRRDPMNSRDRKNTPGEIIKRFKHKGNKPVSGNLSAQLIGLHRFVANLDSLLRYGCNTANSIPQCSACASTIAVFCIVIRFLGKSNPVSAVFDGANRSVI